MKNGVIAGKMQIFSLFVIALGFVIAPLTNGVMPSVLIYWLGFILYFGLNPSSMIQAKWQLWGRRGLFVNIFLVAFLYLLLYSGKKFRITENYYYYLQRGLNYIIRPVSNIANLFYPDEMKRMPNGIDLISRSFLKGTITSFFDTIFYISGSILIGKIISSKNDAK